MVVYYCHIITVLIIGTSELNSLPSLRLTVVKSGRRWIRQSLVGASLFPGLVCSTSFFINFIAISYHSAKAIPFTSMVITVIALYHVNRVKLRFPVF